MSCGMKMYFHAYLNMEVVITLSTVPDILLRHVKSHFIVVGTDHKMAVLGYWQDCWCTRTDEQDITNLSHTLPFYYVILLLDDIQFHRFDCEGKCCNQPILFSHWTHITATYDQKYNGMSTGQQYCNWYGQVLHALLSGCFCSFPGACETNSTPGVVQAKLTSHSMLCWL